jgi:hypothetical protein
VSAARADGYVAIHKASGDIIRIVTDAAAAAPGAAEFLATANARHHEALVAIVAQIRGTGDLRKDLSDEDAARIIYHHFRFEQFRLAADGFGWGEQRARLDLRTRRERSPRRLRGASVRDAGSSGLEGDLRTAGCIDHQTAARRTSALRRRRRL